MGLFNRRPKPAPPKTPAVFIGEDASSIASEPARTTRFFFADTLLEPTRREELPDGMIRLTTGDWLPDRDAYLALLEKLRAVIHQDEYGNGLEKLDLTRCYPHYIALQWAIEKQPEENGRAAAERIEREVIDILAEYFGWEQPVEVGRFQSFEERHHMSQKLGVSWSYGSYH